MKVLIAPNAFKNSLTAAEAALAIQMGLQRSKLVCDCLCFPVGDGGDGTGELIIGHCGGENINAVVKNPVGKPVTTTFGLIDNGQTAVIEMADASGLKLLTGAELNPLRTTSFGTGELILKALDKGVKKIILGMGGSATVDGGTGILSALGIRFLDKEKQELSHLPEHLIYLHSVDISGAEKRLKNCEIIVLCDVNNHLLGNEGAASVFGPQKGADEKAIIKLEAALMQFNDTTKKTTGIDMAAVKHSGTAGGAAAGLHAYFTATLVSGGDYFLKLTQFKKALQDSQLVITGEGSIDEQTVGGKAPFAVAQYAKEAGVPVIALAGKVPLLISPTLSNFFDAVLQVNHEIGTLETALKSTEQNLIRTAEALGNVLSLTWGHK